MNNLYLLIGESGSGKSSIERKLVSNYGLKKVLSYTTRPVRDDDPNDIFTHTFITKGEFDKLDNRVAYTKYDNNEYCATSDQLEEADIYVIDPAGIEFLEHNYRGKKGLVKIYIHCSLSERMKRLENRDGFDAALNRVKTDIIEFRGVKDYCDYIVKNEGDLIDNAVDSVMEIIKECERSSQLSLETDGDHHG